MARAHAMVAITEPQCVKPSQPWPGRSTASSRSWISSCHWSCTPFPCWHTWTPAASGTSWTRRLPPCSQDVVVSAKKNERSPPTHTYTHRHTLLLAERLRRLQLPASHGGGRRAFLRQYNPAYGVRSEGRPVNGVRQSSAVTSPLNCLNCLWKKQQRRRGVTAKKKVRQQASDTY